jgi:hypothetical protein
VGGEGVCEVGYWNRGESTEVRDMIKGGGGKFCVCERKQNCASKWKVI